MKYRVKYTALVVVIMLLVSGCAGNRAPAQIAGDVAHNGTIVVNSVDALQKYVASQEAAGRIPRNQSVTAMEALGRSLAAAKTAGGYLDKLVALTAPTQPGDPLLKQLQDALALASSEAAMALVPIGDEATRAQVAKLVAEINTAIGQVNQFILSRRTS